MKKIAYLLLFVALTVASTMNAQTRYLDQVFPGVTKTTAIYGSNFTVITLSTPLMKTARSPLVMDVYQPIGDAEVARPLIIYAHTGNFLPWVDATGKTINGACGGTRTDSGTVEICTRLAKMGYVVASIDYRQGWRPDLIDELQRRFGLINAAYRGVQDVRTCVRFFRKSVALQANPFKIDENRIVVWGQGTGGYISLAAASLDSYNKILDTDEPGKFFVNGFPMILEAYNGDPYGVQAAPGIVDALYNGATGFPIGDTIYVQNHPGYSSDFKLAVNMGGALGDKKWLDANTVPIISYAVPADPFAPCGDGTVIVPGFNYAVVNVTGSCGVQPIMETLNNNDVFETGGLLTDPTSVTARAINGNIEGFYPLRRPATDSAPWEWNGYVPFTILPNGMQVNLACSTNATTARATIDTIIRFFAPRGCRALGLGCAGVSTSTQELVNDNRLVVLAPNPAQSEVVFNTDADHTITAIEIYDVTGRVVRVINRINAQQYTLQRENMNTGMYLAKIHFPDGIAVRRVVFE